MECIYQLCNNIHIFNRHSVGINYYLDLALKNNDQALLDKCMKIIGEKEINSESIMKYKIKILQDREKELKQIRNNVINNCNSP